MAQTNSKSPWQSGRFTALAAALCCTAAAVVAVAPAPAAAQQPAPDLHEPFRRAFGGRLIDLMVRFDRAGPKSYPASLYVPRHEWCDLEEFRSAFVELERLEEETRHLALSTRMFARADLPTPFDADIAQAFSMVITDDLRRRESELRQCERINPNRTGGVRGVPVLNPPTPQPPPSSPVDPAPAPVGSVPGTTPEPAPVAPPPVVTPAPRNYGASLLISPN